MRGLVDENSGKAIDGKMLCLEAISVSSPA
jgi:hypothetical protein